MSRNYTVKEYKNLVQELSKRIEGITIGADVMVGFPGEGKEDFEITCEFIQSIPLAYLHVFSYSDRKGTSASRMPDKVSTQGIKSRSRLLHQIGKEKWEKHLDNFMGKKMEVLVESNRDKSAGRLIGMTGNYIRVLVNGKEGFKNKILSAKMVKKEGRYLVGEIANG